MITTVRINQSESKRATREMPVRIERGCQGPPKTDQAHRFAFHTIQADLSWHCQTEELTSELQDRLGRRKGRQPLTNPHGYRKPILQSRVILKHRRLC